MISLQTEDTPSGVTFTLHDDASGRKQIVSVDKGALDVGKPLVVAVGYELCGALRRLQEQAPVLDREAN